MPPTTIPKIILYRKDGACSLVPRALLTHLRIPFTAIPMQSGPDGLEAVDGSLLHAEFRRVNPAGYVPILTVDDEAVTEMPAILTYIASLVPEQNLLMSMSAERAMDRARVAEWLAWLSGTLHNAFAAIWRPYRFTDDAGAHESVARRGREVVDAGFARIEARLRGREWAVSEAGATVVDFRLYVFWRWGGAGWDRDAGVVS
jgi:glutathione S-transferase